nr:phage baseplate assembly protein V [Brevibacillus laterosporus]
MDNAVNDLIRIGKVSSVDPTTGTARVVFEDTDESVSFDLPILFPQTMAAKHYGMPIIDENVICLFLGNGVQTGICLGSFYSTVDKPPVTDKNKQGIWFENGSYVEYDRSSGILTLKATGGVVIEGDVMVKGTIQSTGESV